MGLCPGVNNSLLEIVTIVGPIPFRSAATVCCPGCIVKDLGKTRGASIAFGLTWILLAGLSELKMMHGDRVDW